MSADTREGKEGIRKPDVLTQNREAARRKKRFIRQKRALRTDARKGRNKIAQGIALGDGIFDDFKL